MSREKFNLRKGIGVEKTVVLTLDGNACYMLKKLLAAAQVAIKNDPASLPSITMPEHYSSYLAVIEDLESVL